MATAVTQLNRYVEYNALNTRKKISQKIILATNDVYFNYVLETVTTTNPGLDGVEILFDHTTIFKMVSVYDPQTHLYKKIHHSAHSFCVSFQKSFYQLQDGDSFRIKFRFIAAHPFDHTFMKVLNLREDTISRNDASTFEGYNVGRRGAISLPQQLYMSFRSTTPPVQLYRSPSNLTSLLLPDGASSTTRADWVTETIKANFVRTGYMYSKTISTLNNIQGSLQKSFTIQFTANSNVVRSSTRTQLAIFTTSTTNPIDIYDPNVVMSEAEGGEANNKKYQCFYFYMNRDVKKSNSSTEVPTSFIFKTSETTAFQLKCGCLHIFETATERYSDFLNPFCIIDGFFDKLLTYAPSRPAVSP